MRDGDRTEEIETLLTRLGLLERICQSPVYTRDIIDETGQARSTVHRALNELIELGLVKRQEGRMEATLSGRLARDQLRAYLDGFDDIRKAQAVIDPLPADVDIEYEVLQGAESSLAMDPAPYRPADYAHDELANATGYRALLPTLEESRTVRILYEHVITQEHPVELVVSLAVFRTLQEEFPRRMALLAETDLFRVFVGETPSYTLGLLDRGGETAGGQNTAAHIIVHNTNGGVHGLLVNETDDGVSWAQDTYERYRAGATDRTAELIADSDGGVEMTSNTTASVVGQSLPIALERQGFVRVDERYFQQESVASPETAWRTGLSLAEVQTGYGLPRPDAELKSDDEHSLTDTLIEALESEVTCAIVGPPGTGKSTVCKQVACEWYRSGRGTVLYRDERGRNSIESVDELVTLAEQETGHTLIVVEDAVRPDSVALVESIDRFADIEGVSILFDSREYEWNNYVKETGGRVPVEVKHLPSLSRAECERFVDHFERTLGRPVNISVDKLWDALGDEGGNTTSQMLRLTHRLATYAEPVTDEPTGLEDAVAETYDKLAADDVTHSVGLLVNVLNATGIEVTEPQLYAVAEQSSFSTVDTALTQLKGVVLFPQEDRYRTVHEEWSVTFISYFLKKEERGAAAARFNEVLSDWLNLADDHRLREEIASHRGERALLEDAGTWVDKMVERLFTVARTQSKLAPLFGDGEKPAFRLPAACSETVVANEPVWLGEVFLSAGYYDRATRAFQRVGDEPQLVIEQLLGLARIHIERGEYEAAQASCEECLDVLDTAASDFSVEEAALLRARTRFLLGETFSKYNQYEEAEAQFEAVREGNSPELQPQLFARTLARLGDLACKQGELKLARERYEQSLELIRECGDRRAEAEILNGYGAVPWVEGDNEEARARYEQVLELRQLLGDRHGEGKTLYNLGILAKRQSQYKLAAEQFERSLTLLREVGDRHTEVKVLGALGLNLMRQGEYNRATDLFEQWRAYSQELGDQHDEARALNNLALVAKRTGEYERAEKFFEQSLERKEAIGDTRGVARTLSNIGEVAILQGRFNRATDVLNQSIEQKETFDGNAEIGSTQNKLGTVALKTGQLTLAQSHFENGLDAATQAGEMNQQALALNGLAHVALAQEDSDIAWEHLERAFDLVAREETTLVTELTMTRARLACSEGSFEEAQREAMMALETAEKLSAAYWQGQCQLLLGQIAVRAGDDERAQECFYEAFETFETLGAYHDAGETLERLASSESVESSTFKHYLDRGTALFSSAPEEVSKRHKRWLEDG